MAVAKKGAPAKKGAQAAPGQKPQVKSTGLTQDALKAAGAGWKSVPPPPPNSFGDLPDGPFQAKIEEALIENGGKNRDRLQVKWAFRITGPTHANRMTWSNTGLADEKGVEITKRYLGTLGLPIPNEIEELPPVLGKAKGMAVEIRTRTVTTDQGTFQNTYMNKRLDAAVAAGETAATTETANFVGQTVKFDGGEGSEITGVVQSQNGDQLNVKDEAGQDWEVGLADISVVTVDAQESPAVAEAVEPAKAAEILGKTVEFADDKGKKVQGKVEATNGEGVLTVKVGDEEWEVPEAEVKVVVAASAASAATAKPAAKKAGATKK